MNNEKVIERMRQHAEEFKESNSVLSNDCTRAADAIENLKSGKKTYKRRSQRYARKNEQYQKILTQQTAEINALKAHAPEEIKVNCKILSEQIELLDSCFDIVEGEYNKALIEGVAHFLSDICFAIEENKNITFINWDDEEE